MSDAKLGARNDDSSLFSLDSLKKKEAELSAQPNKQGEDSGMIDLKALAASMQKSDGAAPAASPFAPVNNDLFQIQAPITNLAPLAQSLLSTPVDERMVPQGAVEIAPPKSKAPMIVAGVAVVVALGAVAFAFTRGSDTPPPAPTVAAVTPQSAAPTAVAAPEEPKIAAVTPGQRAPKEEAPPKPTATAAVAPPPTPRPQGGGGGQRTAPAPKAPKEEAPKAPAAPACDLACQMQRAVNGKK